MTASNLVASLQTLWQKDRLLETANTMSRKRANAPNLWAAPSDIVPKKELMYLSVGIPDSENLPRAQLNAAMQAVLENPQDTSLRYGFGPGYFPVRKFLAEKYAQDKKLAVTPDWFQLTNGSSAAIDLVVRAFIEPGDVIATETPSYMGSLANFTGVGADICSIPVDNCGLDVAGLEKQIQDLKSRGKRLKMVYTISTFQNPSGVTLSYERKKALLELAAREAFLILDDDAYGDLYYDTPPSDSLLQMSGGYGVITVGTFSKTVATGLRIGWICAHPDMLAFFARMKFDMGQNQMALHMMGHFLASGHLDTHLKKMRALYKMKMTQTVDAMNRFMTDFVTFQIPAGGFYLWVKLNPGLTANAVWRTATHEGIAVNPGPSFMPDYRPGKGEYLRIAFCWTPATQLEEAVCRLATACRRVVDNDAA